MSSGFLAEPIYALKVVVERNGSFGAPVAPVDYGAMIRTGRWRRARGKAYRKWGSYDNTGRYRRPSVRYAPYDGPSLCVSGWHVWPVRTAITADSSRRPTYSWRTLRDGKTRMLYESGRARVFLVSVRGSFVADLNKLAADDMRFVRELTPAEQRLLRTNAKPDALRRALGLPTDARLLERTRDAEGYSYTISKRGER